MGLDKAEDKIEVTVEEYNAIMDKAIEENKGNNTGDTLIKLLEIANKYRIVDKEIRHG